jgi:hypothetical protein
MSEVNKNAFTKSPTKFQVQVRSDVPLGQVYHLRGGGIRAGPPGSNKPIRTALAMKPGFKVKKLGLPIS